MDFAKRLLVIADYLDRVYDLKDPTYMEHYSENIKKNINIIYTHLLFAEGLTPSIRKKGINSMNNCIYSRPADWRRVSICNLAAVNSTSATATIPS